MSRVQRLYWGFRIPHSLFRVGLVVALLLGMLPSQAGASSIQPEQYIPSGQGSQQATEPGPVPTPLPPAEWPETLPFRHSPYTPSL